MEIISDRKIELMQDKNLLHKLYMDTLSGSEQLTPEDRSALADIIIRRETKTCTTDS